MRGGHLVFDDSHCDDSLNLCRECYEAADVTGTLFKNSASVASSCASATQHCNCEERGRYGYDVAQPPFEYEGGEFIPARAEESAQVSDDDSQKTDVDEE